MLVIGHGFGVRAERCLGDEFTSTWRIGGSVVLALMAKCRLVAGTSRQVALFGVTINILLDGGGVNTTM